MQRWDMGSQHRIIDSNLGKSLKRSARIPTFHNNHWETETDFVDSVTLYDTNGINVDGVSQTSSRD